MKPKSDEIESIKKGETEVKREAAYGYATEYNDRSGIETPDGFMKAHFIERSSVEKLNKGQADNNELPYIVMPKSGEKDMNSRADRFAQKFEADVPSTLSDKDGKPLKTHSKEEAKGKEIGFTGATEPKVRKRLIQDRTELFEQRPELSADISKYEMSLQAKELVMKGQMDDASKLASSIIKSDEALSEYFSEKQEASKTIEKNFRLSKQNIISTSARALLAEEFEKADQEDKDNHKATESLTSPDFGISQDAVSLKKETKPHEKISDKQRSDIADALNNTTSRINSAKQDANKQAKAEFPSDNKAAKKRAVELAETITEQVKQEKGSRTEIINEAIDSHEPRKDKQSVNIDDYKQYVKEDLKNKVARKERDEQNPKPEKQEKKIKERKGKVKKPQPQK